jgi:hypothetical protein
MITSKATMLSAPVSLTSNVERVLNDAITIFRHGRPNFLLIGNDAAVECALDRLRAYLAAPIAIWTSRIPAQTPFRTLIVRHIERLNRAEQVRLMDLSAGAVQVISTTSVPLFPAVERGTFDEGLYYRLNVVLLNLPAVSEHRCV